MSCDQIVQSLGQFMNVLMKILTTKQIAEVSRLTGTVSLLY